jgi:Lamin Tail Domain
MSLRRSLALLLLASALLVPSAAGSGTGAIVIGQLYASGGNAGAAFTHDYVELFNRGTSAVSLSGWSLQYATAAGTSWSVTALAGSIPAGGSYLVHLASGANGAAPPAPDATGTTNLAATGGKIAVVRDAAALTCGASAGSCSAVTAVEDLVGYGSASDYEGSGAAAAPGATTALMRAGDGCTDADQNGSDLATAAASPRNSASALRPCSIVEPPPTGGVSADAAVAVEIQPVISISLERATLDFGRTPGGTPPAPIGERVSVVNNNAAGYTLSVGRSPFVPSDLPLALQATAPAGGVLAPPFAGGAFVGVPAAPAAAIAIGTTSAASPAAGDQWPTNVGFLSPFPNAASGRYTATLTFTVIGR